MRFIKKIKFRYKKGVHDEAEKCEKKVNWQIDLKSFYKGGVQFWGQLNNIKCWILNSELKNEKWDKYIWVYIYKRGVHSQTKECERKINWQKDLKYIWGYCVEIWNIGAY